MPRPTQAPALAEASLEQAPTFERVSTPEAPRPPEKPVAPEPAKVAQEAVADYQRAEHLIERTAAEAGAPIDVLEAEKVGAEKDHQEAYFEAAFGGLNYSGEYELGKLEAVEAGTQNINEFIFQEQGDRHTYGEQAMTLNEAVRLREILIEWDEQGFDATLIRDYNNERGVKDFVKKRHGAKRIKSLVSTDTKRETARGVLAGKVKKIEQIGLTKEEELIIRKRTERKHQKAQEKKEKREKQKESLSEVSLEPLINSQVWEIVTHNENAVRQADNLLTPNKTVIIGYEESRSGQMDDEIKEELNNIDGDVAVVLAGSDLSGCMETTFLDIRNVASTRQGKTDIHILLPDTVNGTVYGEMGRGSPIETTSMPVIVDGEIYDGGKNEKARLFVWSSAEKMKEKWTDKRS